MEIDDFIPTKGSNKKKNANKSHDVIIYKNHKKLTNLITPSKQSLIEQQQLSDRNKNISTDNKDLDKKKNQELEMKKYRYDVIKFGMSGFQKHEAQQAKVALAIRLGAKPPKNKNLNYKKLIQLKKTEKVQEIKKQKFASGFNLNQLSKKNKKDKKSNSQHKKSNESNILGVYGKVTKENKNSKKKLIKQKIKI